MKAAKARAKRKLRSKRKIFGPKVDRQGNPWTNTMSLREIEGIRKGTRKRKK